MSGQQPSSRSWRPALLHPRALAWKIRALVLGITLLGGAACQDLEVTNPNAPDLERALATPGDVESLIGGAYYLWFSAMYRWPPGGNFYTFGFVLSAQSFQNTSPWANFAWEHYSRIPRQPIVKDPSHARYGPTASIWTGCYQALSAVAQGFQALDDPEVSDAIGAEGVHRLRTFGRFIQGLAHGTLALLYDQAFIVDEATDAAAEQIPIDHATLMEGAFDYFQEAIQLAGDGDFALPHDWMRTDLTSDDLIRLIRSYRARFRAQLARAPEERVAVDWGAVIADVDGGLQSTLTLHLDEWPGSWYSVFLDYSTYPGWSALPYFIYGMADQSGAVTEWYALDLDEKQPLLPDGRPVLIVTPDLRFPQGATVEEQRAQEGEYFRIFADGESSMWSRVDRGTWRWTWYRPGYGRGADYFMLGRLDQPEFYLEELRLLKAEGLYHMGDLAGAATIVNETRTLHGLSPTDASGTNTSCVPRLPDGECGDLWEMLKWEKRMEVVWTGIGGANWFFDARGWGDLWKNTPLQLPIPCGELEVLQLTPCYTFGGVGGVSSAPLSTYQFNGEEEES